MIIRYAYLGWIRNRCAGSSPIACVHATSSTPRCCRKLPAIKIVTLVATMGLRAFARRPISARVPVRTYDDHRPYINRVLEGDVTALFPAARKC